MKTKQSTMTQQEQQLRDELKTIMGSVRAILTSIEHEEVRLCEWCGEGIKRKYLSKTAWKSRRFCAFPCYLQWREWHKVMEETWPKH